MFIEIVVSKEQIETTAQIAGEVWREHYASIISQTQIDYMLKNFQSPKAIENQINNENCRYYIMKDDDGKPAGYFAAVPGQDDIFLSKLYVKKESRAKGCAKQAVAFLADMAKDLKLSKVWLTVNRNNVLAIEAYKKMGFNIDEEINQNIGGGFFMNDYKMSLKA